jgi:hypothetical protein
MKNKREGCCRLTGCFYGLILIMLEFSNEKFLNTSHHDFFSPPFFEQTLFAKNMAADFRLLFFFRNTVFSPSRKYQLRPERGDAGVVPNNLAATDAKDAGDCRGGL